jgi:hypothetical protein
MNIIVYEDNQFRVTWNESATFYVYMNYIIVDCFTSYQVNSLQDALDLAKDYVQNDIMGEQ